VSGKAKPLESEWRSTAGRDVAHASVASHMVRFFIRPHIVDAPEEVHKQKASGIQNTPAGRRLESAHSRPKWGLL